MSTGKVVRRQGIPGGQWLGEQPVGSLPQAGDERRPVTKSIFLMGSVITRFWSRNPDRRKAADQIVVRILGSAEDELDPC